MTPTFKVNYVKKKDNLETTHDDLKYDYNYELQSIEPPIQEAPDTIELLRLSCIEYKDSTFCNMGEMMKIFSIIRD